MIESSIMTATKQNISHSWEAYTPAAEYKLGMLFGTNDRFHSIYRWILRCLVSQFRAYDKTRCERWYGTSGLEDGVVAARV